MQTLETERLLLNGGGDKWNIIPRSLGEPVGEVKVINKFSGFVTLEIVFNKDWRFGFAEEAIKEIARYFFEETEFYTIRVENSEFEKELLNCGFRPEIRGRSDCGFRLRKFETNISAAELLALAKKAYENDELAEFLCGEKEYAVHGNRDIPLNIPTDFNRVVDCVYKLYSAEKDENIIAAFRRVIEEPDDTPLRVWGAFMACCSQIACEHSTYPAPFKIIDNALLSKLRTALKRNETTLRGCKKWLGINKENGLWDYIVHLNGVYIEEYGISIL